MKQIKSIPQNLRPREKILKQGASALTLFELIAVILTTGTRAHTVLAISGKIEKMINEKKKKNFGKDGITITKEDLHMLGLGPHKVSQILAASEIGIRLAKRDSALNLTSPSVVYANSTEILNADKESLLCFFLNARGELLKKEVVAVGSINKASVLPREIFTHVRDMPVASIILVHNHPSGSLEPSRDDILFTKRVKQAGDILGVALLDHLIVTSSGWRQIKF